MKPAYSFIIPSYNGAKKLPRLIKSIVPYLDTEKASAIVVLDGSADNSIEILESLNQKGLIYFSQKNQGRSVSKNNGALVSENKILFFLDDDMRLTPECFQKHQEHHQYFPESILVGKAALDPELIATDFHKYLSSLYSKWDSDFKIKTRITYTNFLFSSCHLSVPKDLFQKVNGFDPRLKDAEDYDLGMRLLEMDYPIYFEPDAIAWHDDFPTCRQYIQRQLQYKRSHQVLKELGKQYKADLFKPIETPKGIVKKTILRLLKKECCVNWIDSEKLLFLPEPIRYKLYSAIVYAHTLKGMGLL